MKEKITIYIKKDNKVIENSFLLQDGEEFREYIGIPFTRTGKHVKKENIKTAISELFKCFPEDILEKYYGQLKRMKTEKQYDVFFKDVLKQYAIHYRMDVNNLGVNSDQNITRYNFIKGKNDNPTSKGEIAERAVEKVVALHFQYKFKNLSKKKNDDLFEKIFFSEDEKKYLNDLDENFLEGSVRNGVREMAIGISEVEYFKNYQSKMKHLCFNWCTRTAYKQCLKVHDEKKKHLIKYPFINESIQIVKKNPEKSDKVTSFLVSRCQDNEKVFKKKK